MLESRLKWIAEMIVMPLCRWRCCNRGLRQNDLCAFLKVQSRLWQFFACQDICRICSAWANYIAV